MSVFVSIVLDTRRLKKKTKAYPVKLRVTFERKVRYYLTRYDLTEEAYSKLNSSRLKGTDLIISDALKDLQRDAEKLAKDLDPFSFLEFEKDFALYLKLKFWRIIQ
jgi:integrase/recombinase XerD